MYEENLNRTTFVSASFLIVRYEDPIIPFGSRVPLCLQYRLCSHLLCLCLGYSGTSAVNTVECNDFTGI